MPDALSKTIPIWCVCLAFFIANRVEMLTSRCSVINRAVARRTPSLQETGEWDELYLPAGVVSPSEREQIIALLPTWTESLLVGPLIPTSHSKFLYELYLMR